MIGTNIYNLAIVTQIFLLEESEHSDVPNVSFYANLPIEGNIDAVIRTPSPPLGGELWITFSGAEAEQLREFFLKGAMPKFSTN